MGGKTTLEKDVATSKRALRHISICLFTLVFSNDVSYKFNTHVLPELLTVFLGPRVRVVLQDQSAEEKYHIGTWHMLLPSEVCFGFEFYVCTGDELGCIFVLSVGHTVQ